MYLYQDGSNYVKALSTAFDAEPVRRGQLICKLKEALPDLLDVVPAWTGDGQGKCNFVFQKGEQPVFFDMSDLSVGTLKMLIWWYLFQVREAHPTSLLAIDEPENNLHVAWQKLLCEWMQQSRAYQQCLISTHSPDFLDGFTEGFKRGLVSVFVEDSFGCPVKLSDELISAVEYQAEKCFPDKDAGMLKGLRYAKSQEGITMLRSLDYTVLLEKCRRLFRQECLALKQLHD